MSKGSTALLYGQVKHIQGRRVYFDKLMLVDNAPIMGISQAKDAMPYCCQVKVINYGTDNFKIIDKAKMTKKLVQEFITKTVETKLLNDVCGGVFAYVPIDDKLKLVLNYFKDSPNWEEVIKIKKCSIFWAEGLSDGYGDDDNDDEDTWW